MFEGLGLNVARQPDNGGEPAGPTTALGVDGGRHAADPRSDELIDSQAEANFLGTPRRSSRVVKKKGQAPGPTRSARPDAEPAPAGWGD